MAKFEVHCKESLETFGKDYAEVHRWLDELAPKFNYTFKHRKVRHHLAGIEEVRKRWGDEAAEAARQHITTDLLMAGWDPKKESFPEDGDYYTRHW